MSDAQWSEFLRELYERKRLKGKQLRQADIARRKARALPDTLMEAIERHLRAKPRVRHNTLTSPARHTHGHLAQLTSIVNEVLAADPWLHEISEAAALSPAERLAKFGGLVGLPFDCIATLPPHMTTDPEYRFELPRWCLAARYDCGIRDDYFVDLLDGKVDQPTLDKRLGEPKYFNPYSAPVRSLRPDEVGLSGAERAHLKKLRDKLKRAMDYLKNAERSGHADSINKAQTYVATAEASIRAARASYGLPEVDLID